MCAAKHFQRQGACTRAEEEWLSLNTVLTKTTNPIFKVTVYCKYSSAFQLPHPCTCLYHCARMHSSSASTLYTHSNPWFSYTSFKHQGTGPNLYPHPSKSSLVMNKFTAHYSGLDLLQNSAGTNNLVCQHLSLDSSINVSGPNLNSKVHLTAGP